MIEVLLPLCKTAFWVFLLLLGLGILRQDLCAALAILELILDQAGLEPCVSASWVLGLQACTASALSDLY